MTVSLTSIIKRIVATTNNNVSFPCTSSSADVGVSIDIDILHATIVIITTIVAVVTIISYAAESINFGA